MAVETDTNWPAFMKVYDFSLTKLSFQVFLTPGNWDCFVRSGADSGLPCKAPTMEDSIHAGWSKSLCSWTSHRDFSLCRVKGRGTHVKFMSIIRTGISW